MKKLMLATLFFLGCLCSSILYAGRAVPEKGNNILKLAVYSSDSTLLEHYYIKEVNYYQTCHHKPNHDSKDSNILKILPNDPDTLTMFDSITPGWSAKCAKKGGYARRHLEWYEPILTLRDKAYGEDPDNKDPGNNFQIHFGRKHAKRTREVDTYALLDIVRQDKDNHIITQKFWDYQ